MASAMVMGAVEDRLAELWALCPILSENIEGSAPSDGSPYLVVQYPVSSTQRWAMNERFYREAGAFRIVIHTEVGEGTAKDKQWGDALTSMFRDRRFGGIETQVPSEPTEGQGDGNYHVTSFSCPFTRFFHD